jgi:NAD(P)-dependent dehydrogenase (short-subunit alcohol dehydrogenase family)
MKRDLFDLQDRIIVITGGMGQLGRQFTLALVERGARVAIFDQQANEETAAERFKGLEQQRRNIIFLRVDVTQKESIVSGLSYVSKTWGVPHALINNAALDSPPGSDASENGPVETYSEDSWDKVMAVNVKGSFLCCQVIGGKMAAERRGSIVNVCSIYGVVSPDQRIYEYRRRTGSGFFKPVAYSASKSALLNMTRYLATYWAARNVRVNTVTFGGVYNNQDSNFLKEYCARVPLGRMAREDEYNGAIVFLVSDASSYMTGSNLIIDGGWTAW